MPAPTTSDTNPWDPTAAWRRLGAVAPPDLAPTRLTLHHALQLLASFGQALVEARPDDSHRAVTWAPNVDGLLGQASPHGLRVRLRVASFAVELLGGDAVVARLDLRGRTLHEALAWLDAAVARERSSAGVGLVWPEYDLPPRSEGRDAPLDPDVGALAELAAWYGNAWAVLTDLARRTPEASDVRCWPHHFDLAALMTFSGAADDGEDRFVGVGLSPGDGPTDAPYYYVNGWPPPAPDALPPLEGPGAWHLEGWTGVVLHADTVVSAGGGAEQDRLVRDFVEAAVRTMRAAVLPAR